MLDLSVLNDWTFISDLGTEQGHICCALSAISVLRNEELSDRHKDVCPVIRKVVIDVNDHYFDDQDVRKKWALEIIPRVVGSFNIHKTEKRMALLGFEGNIERIHRAQAEGKWAFMSGSRYTYSPFDVERLLDV